MKNAILSLGTNIGDREEHMKTALAALKLLPHTALLRVSPVYETSPVGYLEQGDFLNCVVELKTELSPNALLGACLGIEAAMGRERTFKNAPRVIDIDLLLYEGITLEEAELTLPHPRIRERAFVLIPLRDLFKDMRIYGVDFSESLKSVDKNDVKAVGGMLL